MADSFGSYTYAFYMSGAVVIAGSCIPFLLLFTKTKEPGEEVSESLELNDAIDGISVTMNADGKGKETEADTGSQEKTFVFVSSV